MIAGHWPLRHWPAPSLPAAGTISGYVSTAEDRLARMLAASTTFQALVVTAGQAENHIHNDGLPIPAGDGYTLAELRTYYPFAVIWTDERNGLRLDKAAYLAYRDSGTLRMRLIREVPTALSADYKAAERDWKNVVGGILSDLIGMSGTGTYLEIRSLSLEELYRNDPDDRPTQGECQAAELSFDWGISE
jgi:hypothetical protein